MRIQWDIAGIYMLEHFGAMHGLKHIVCLSLWLMPNTANCEKSCADFFAPKEVQQKAWRSQAKTWPQKSFGFMALKYVANTVAKSQFAVCINFTSNNVLKPEVWFLLVSLHGYQPRSCVLLNELCSQVGSQGFSWRGNPLQISCPPPEFRGSLSSKMVGFLWFSIIFGGSHTQKPRFPRVSGACLGEPFGELAGFPPQEPAAGNLRQIPRQPWGEVQGGPAPPWWMEVRLARNHRMDGNCMNMLL